MICTACFQVVGKARDSASLVEIQRQHQCAKRTQPVDPDVAAPGVQEKDRPLQIWSGSRVRRSLLVLVAVAVLYLFPTWCELTVHRFLDADFVMIAIGDLAGCLSIALAFGKLRLGALLYIALAIGKVSAIEFGVLSSEALIWISDVVPTVIAAGLLQRRFAQNQLTF